MSTTKGGRRQTPDAGAAENEINRSLDTVVGNVALLLTRLDPDSDARARAWRALEEAKHVREIINDMVRVSRGVAGDRLRGSGSLADVQTGPRRLQAS